MVNLTVQLKPEQISRIIRSQIKYYQNAIEQSETGTVTMVGDGIARAAGLDNCMAGELVQFESGAYGMAQNLEENSVSIVLLGDDSGIKEGSSIHRTGKVVSVPVGEGMIGRVVNALGQPIDGKGPIEAADYRAIESPAPGILDRQPVKQPLQTGIKAIDSMIPIGRGQRELIIGDRQTGKTVIATDTIIRDRQSDSGGRVRPARLCLRHPLHPHHGTAGDHRRLQRSPSGGAAAAGADPSQGVQQLLPPDGALRPGYLHRPLPQVRGLPPGKGLRHRQSRQTGLTALESLWNFTCLRNAQARFFVFPHILR